ncbi:MAG: hypothetical protein ACKOHI_00700, partial [Phycisphaerales bacterium]
RSDAEATSEEFTRDAVEGLDMLRPYGRGNPAPTFLLRGARPLAPPTRFGREREPLDFVLAGGARAIVWRAGAAGRARRPPGPARGGFRRAHRLDDQLHARHAAVAVHRRLHQEVDGHAVADGRRIRVAGTPHDRARTAGDADAASIRHGVPVDLLVQPSMDSYGGVPRVQLVVEAMRAPEPAGVR